MKFERVSLILVVGVFCAWEVKPTRALAITRDEARELLRKSDAPSRASALRAYEELASSGGNAELSAEYALALAAAGLSEAALWEMDRALLLDAANEQVLYSCSTLMAAFGHQDIADELSQPAPEWAGGATILAKRSRLQRHDSYPSPSEFGSELVAADILMRQGRYATVVDRLARITAHHPREPMGWAAYSIALEKLGAFKAAARASVHAEPLEKASERQAELATHAPVTIFKANQGLQGLYTAYLGGGFSHASGSTNYAVNLQGGKFLSARFNLSIATGYSKTSEFTIGTTGRVHQPLPGSAPLNLTAGTRIDYSSSAAAFSFLLSPGVSYFIREGSIDAVLDVGVAGSQSGVVTFSMGYTRYFGGFGS